MNPRPFHSVFLTALLLFNLLGIEAWGQQPPTRLLIVVVEGDGAVNNIRQRISREPIVEVQDENHRPIAGAAVTFFLPNQGPGGTFANGTNSLTTTTDAQGRATARGIQFNSQPGTMQIRVVASFSGQTANEVVTQTNVLGGAAASSSGGGSAKLWIILGIVGAAAAGGAIVATHGGSSSAAPAPTPTTTITPGTPTVGGQ